MFFDFNEQWVLYAQYTHFSSTYHWGFFWYSTLNLLKAAEEIKEQHDAFLFEGMILAAGSVNRIELAYKYFESANAQGMCAVADRALMCFIPCAVMLVDERNQRVYVCS